MGGITNGKIIVEGTGQATSGGVSRTNDGLNHTWIDEMTG